MKVYREVSVKKKNLEIEIKIKMKCVLKEKVYFSHRY